VTLRTQANGQEARDVVVFDATSVQERASITTPAVHPAGFVHVLVNGQMVLQDGQRNGARAGRVLRAR